MLTKLKVDAAAVQFIRKPAFLLSVAAGLGLALLLLAVMLFLLPQHVEMRGIMEEVAEAKRQEDMMKKIPIPTKATEAEVLKLLEQVPLKEESVRLLRMLRETAELSGIVVTSLSFGEDGESQESSLEKLIVSASEAEQQSQASPGASGQTAATPSPGAASPAAKLSFQESAIQLDITGYYCQVMDFVDRLYAQPRIMQIQEWSWSQGQAAQAQMGAGGLSAAGTTTGLQASLKPNESGGMPITMKLKLTSYSAPQYSGKLQDLPPPPLEASPAAERKDPTRSDEMMWELLPTGQPKPLPGGT